MKILTREQFKQMPKGTVFRKVVLTSHSAGILWLLDSDDSQLKILAAKPWEGDEDGTIDYFYKSLGVTMLPKDVDVDDNEAFIRMMKGEQIDYGHIGERDGLFDGEEVGYAVYTESEIKEMIQMLQSALASK